MKLSFVLHVLSVIFVLCFFSSCAGSGSHSQLESTITDNFPEGENIIPLSAGTSGTITESSNDLYSATLMVGAVSIVTTMSSNQYTVGDSFFQLKDQSQTVK